MEEIKDIKTVTITEKDFAEAESKCIDTIMSRFDDPKAVMLLSIAMVAFGVEMAGYLFGKEDNVIYKEGLM